MKMFDFILNAHKYIVSYNTFTDNTINTNSPLKDIMDSNEAEHFIIIPYSMTGFRDGFVKVFQKYHLSELFDLSECFAGPSYGPYVFLHIVSQPVDRIKVSMYSKPAHPYRNDLFDDPVHNKVHISDKYLPEYLNYLESLDSWVKTGNQPEDSDFCMYRNLNSDGFNPKIVYPWFYMHFNDEIREILKGERVAKLSDMAEITGPNEDNKKTFEAVKIPENCSPSLLVDLLNKASAQIGLEPIIAKTLPINPFPSYPYIPDKDSIMGAAKNIKVHKNDIMMSSDGAQVFLVDKESSFDLFVPAGITIIRARKDISPEYLFIYLRSKIAWKIKRALTTNGSLTLDVSDFPVVMPVQDDSYYKEQFRKLSTPDERIYEKIVESIQRPENTVANILNAEMLREIIHNNEKLLQDCLKDDVTELNACFKAKAYKATVLMAGAVLETFLIDLISEIEGKNYFAKQKMVPDIDRKTKKQKTDQYGNGLTKKADLIDYIDMVFKNAEELGEKAHHIRNMRNSIHTKVCYNRSEKVCADTCKMVIDELNEILLARNNLVELLRLQNV